MKIQSHEQEKKAIEIVETIIQSDDPMHIAENLREMMDEFLIYTERETAYKNSVYDSFYVLNNALSEIATIAPPSGLKGGRS